MMIMFCKIENITLWKKKHFFVLRILKEGRQYDDLPEVAKLFNIHAAE